MPILCLCAGDKPRSFVGSRNWIGAIELGYVLDERLGVTCKVLTVASGADMASKARELEHHFDTQARPLAFFGGVGVRFWVLLQIHGGTL